MTEDEYINYFKTLAARHVAIQHTPEVNRVYVVQDNNRKEVELAVKSKLRLPALMLDQYYDDLDRSQDNFRLKITGGISILTQCRGQDPLDVRRARQQARQIAISFINRLYKDCRHPDGLLFSKRMVPSTSFSGEGLDVIGGTATGWGYPFELEMPISVAVDPADWVDL